MRFIRQIHSTRLSLSHIGKQPISLPESVKCVISPHPTQPLSYDRILTITGPKATLAMPLHSFIRIKTPANTQSPTDPKLSVSVVNPNDKFQKAMWGTTRSLMANMVTGVTDAFQVQLSLVGVGYRVMLEDTPILRPRYSQHQQQKMSGKAVSLKVGYSHPIIIPIPEGIDASIPNPTTLILTSSDLQKVKNFAMTIREWRKPEPYNQKGIFVDGETIKKKEGKKK